jgi:hypothetical protein
MESEEKQKTDRENVKINRKRRTRCREKTEQDLMDRDREPGRVAAAAGRVAAQAPEKAVDRAPAGRDGDRDRAPDSREGAGTRAPAEEEATRPLAGNRAEEGAGSAEPFANRMKEDVKMPGMDGTGPRGTGPIGGGRGPCGRGMGRGRAMGLGMGMGAGNRAGRGGWFGRIWGRQNPGSDPATDRAALEDQVRMLENDLQAVRRQLDARGSTTREE